MSKLNKTLMAVLAILPFILLVFYFFAVISTFSALGRQGSPDADMLSSGITAIITIAVLMMILTLTSMVLYIIHAVKNQRLNSDERLMWILLIVFASIIAVPIYWFMVINKKEDNVVE